MTSNEGSEKRNVPASEHSALRSSKRPWRLTLGRELLSEKQTVIQNIKKYSEAAGYRQNGVLCALPALMGGTAMGGEEPAMCLIWPQHPEGLAAPARLLVSK
jgi:hypothetical protein